MTNADVAKVNAGCASGFQLNVYNAVMRKEKDLTKKIPMGDNRYLEATLTWSKEVVNKTNDYGCTYPVETGNVKPILHLSVWTSKENGMATSRGLGYWLDAGEPVKRRSVKALQELTKEYTEDEILREFEKAKATQRNLFE